jgi:hypothetical protein
MNMETGRPLTYPQTSQLFRQSEGVRPAKHHDGSV